MQLQYLMVYVVVAAAIGYSILRTAQAIHGKETEDPRCAGCTLKAQCQKKNQKDKSNGQKGPCNDRR